MMPFPNASALGLVIALGLGAVACGGDDDGEASQTGADASGGDVFAVEAPTIDGRDYSLAKHANSDLVLWFWAPW